MLHTDVEIRLLLTRERIEDLRRTLEAEPGRTTRRQRRQRGGHDLARPAAAWTPALRPATRAPLKL